MSKYLCICTLLAIFTVHTAPKMKKTITLALVALAATVNAQQKITGFTDASAGKELQAEKTFDASLSAPRIGETIKELSAFPHNLGSPGSKAVAEKILQKYKSFGLDAHIETYTVLYPTPKTRRL